MSMRSALPLLQVSDSTSSTVLFGLLSQQSRARQSFFNSLSRLFDGLRRVEGGCLLGGCWRWLEHVPSLPAFHRSTSPLCASVVRTPPHHPAASERTT